MKAHFKPNRYGGWYWTLFDDEGLRFASGYRRSYRAARRAAVKTAKRLSRFAFRTEHTIEI